MAEEAPPRLLKVSETAERMSVSPWTVYRMISRGDLPAIRLGSGPCAPLRVDANELERWIYSEDAA
jgi:excisionase family DNA binding protein